MGEKRMTSASCSISRRKMLLRFVALPMIIALPVIRFVFAFAWISNIFGKPAVIPQKACHRLALKEGQKENS